jgi:hypothetical protein
MDTRSSKAHVSAILNASRIVREYPRGGRTPIGRLRRQQAILKLGLTVREAFNCSDEFETLLAAVIDGLRPSDEPPF